ncbi:UNVERIFIED_ORG: hypothetical protein C7432_0734 [Pantoea allii]
MSAKLNKANGRQEDVEEKILSDIKIGYVMPIAKTDGYPDTHWNDVMSILDSTVLGLGISKGRIVSDGGEITTIHSRIVNNLNDDDIIICDVSSRNPNVMFELGMRIAFDKPVIIIKDDITDYCFDSGTIEHIAYPKDLRHGVVNKFQAKLADKIKFTYEKYVKHIQSGTSPILKNFGSFDKRDVQLDELSANEKLLQDIQIIKNSLVRLQMSSSSGFSSANDSATYKKGLIAKWYGNNAQINTAYFNSEQLRDVIDWAVSKNLNYVLDDDKSELHINIESRALNEELVKYLDIVRTRK